MGRWLFVPDKGNATGPRSMGGSRVTLGLCASQNSIYREHVLQNRTNTDIYLTKIKRSEFATRQPSGNSQFCP